MISCRSRPAGRAGRVGVQRIKIEVDRRVHAPEEVAYPALRPRYALLQDYFTPFPVRAASLDDICTENMGLRRSQEFIYCVHFTVDGG